MLNIRQVNHLATALQTTVKRLFAVYENADAYCQEFELVDPAKPNKRREVLDVRGELRQYQDLLLRRVLLPKLVPAPFSHGSVKGRGLRTNVLSHTGSTFVLTADVSNFYPTISYKRIYRLFAEKLGCKADVARICTRFCTYRHHLALGLVTSPALADQVMIPIDQRIAAVCRCKCGKHTLVYTRYVDDITISGNFDFTKSGFPRVLQSVLSEHGLELNPDKNRFGRLSDGEPITKVVIKRGHPDVRREYLVELERQIETANALASGQHVSGPYYTRGQIAGRVQFVCWINPGRRRTLLAKFNSVPWDKVADVAAQLGLVAPRKRLVPIAPAAH